MAHNLPSGVKPTAVLAVDASCAWTPVNMLSVMEAKNILAKPQSPWNSPMRRKCSALRRCSIFHRAVSMNAQLYSASPPAMRTVCTMPSPSKTCVRFFGGQCAGFGPTRMNVPARSPGSLPVFATNGTRLTGLTGWNAPFSALAQNKEPSTSCMESSHWKVAHTAPKRSFSHSSLARAAAPAQRTTRSARRPGRPWTRDTSAESWSLGSNLLDHGTSTTSSKMPRCASRAPGSPL
mmetsp:Transcript_29162/g.88230  ORF Transcript_29162/g.88230 Transcript_29162/m.88230 type:complete len:235 (+) Transcript_29162:1151-1855(+)